MSQKYEKLKTLLKELFQLDQPDLDFGLYRVMHAKSAEVSQFLDKDLLPQVKAAFGQYKSADKVVTTRRVIGSVGSICYAREGQKVIEFVPPSVPRQSDTVSATLWA